MTSLIKVIDVLILKAKVNTAARYSRLSGFTCVPTLNFPVVFLWLLHMHAF